MVRLKPIKSHSQDDAQILVDMVDEAILWDSMLRGQVGSFAQNLHNLSIRYWMAMTFHQRSAGSVCAACTESMAIEPSSRDGREVVAKVLGCIPQVTLKSLQGRA